MDCGLSCGPNCVRLGVVITTMLNIVRLEEQNNSLYGVSAATIYEFLFSLFRILSILINNMEGLEWESSLVRR
jgi:hypothetical protein